MRTDGTMKVAVFEKSIPMGSAKEAMCAYADIFKEASEWIRSEMGRKVTVGVKTHGYHELYNLQVTLDYVADYDEMGGALQLYVHFDDNEKG